VAQTTTVIVYPSNLPECNPFKVVDEKQKQTMLIALKPKASKEIFELKGWCFVLII
jgi:hypothetical protein